MLSLSQVTPPFERLHEQASESPLQWAPVLAMLIHNHRHHIPYTAYAGWLQALHTCSFEDASEPAATPWLLRYLNELAVAWPAALTAAEEGPDAALADISVRQLESQWKVQRTPHPPPPPSRLPTKPCKHCVQPLVFECAGTTSTNWYKDYSLTWIMLHNRLLPSCAYCSSVDCVARHSSFEQCPAPTLACNIDDGIWQCMILPGCTQWTDVWVPACKESRLSGTIWSHGYLPPPVNQQCRSVP